MDGRLSDSITVTFASSASSVILKARAGLEGYLFFEIKF